MSLTKADIIRRVAQNTDLPNNKSYQAVEQLIEIMKDTLASGEDVLISGFGEILCAREIRTPRTKSFYR